jgi:hypothetical protein
VKPLARWAPTVAAVGAGALVLLAGQVQADGIRDQLQQRQGADCPFLLAQAGAPWAPAAPHDAGSLTVAAAANRSFGLYGCEEAGYGPLPPVFAVGSR